MQMTKNFNTRFARFVSDEQGATAVEYGLLAALIAVGAIAAFGILGGGVQNLFGANGSGAGGTMEDAASSL